MFKSKKNYLPVRTTYPYPSGSMKPTIFSENITNLNMDQLSIHFMNIKEIVVLHSLLDLQHFSVTKSNIAILFNI